MIEILEVLWVGILLILTHSCRRGRNGRVGSMLIPGGGKGGGGEHRREHVWRRKSWDFR